MSKVVMAFSFMVWFCVKKNVDKSTDLCYNKIQEILPVWEL